MSTIYDRIIGGACLCAALVCGTAVVGQTNTPWTQSEIDQLLDWLSNIEHQTRQVHYNLGQARLSIQSLDDEFDQPWSFEEMQHSQLDSIDGLLRDIREGVGYLVQDTGGVQKVEIENPLPLPVKGQLGVTGEVETVLTEYTGDYALPVDIVGGNVVVDYINDSVDINLDENLQIDEPVETDNDTLIDIPGQAGGGRAQRVVLHTDSAYEPEPETNIPNVGATNDITDIQEWEDLRDEYDTPEDRPGAFSNVLGKWESPKTPDASGTDDKQRLDDMGDLVETNDWLGLLEWELPELGQQAEFYKELDMSYIVNLPTDEWVIQFGWDWSDKTWVVWMRDILKWCVRVLAIIAVVDVVSTLLTGGAFMGGN
jgi:hypothetical protein